MTSSIHYELVTDGATKMSDSGKNIPEVEGPFGFGNAIQLDAQYKQVRSYFKVDIIDSYLGGKMLIKHLNIFL